MATQDKCCTIVPYFEVQSGKLEDFKALCERYLNTAWDAVQYLKLFNIKSKKENTKMSPMFPRSRSEMEQAQAAYKKNLEMEEKLDNKGAVATAYGYLGDIYRIRIDLDQAEEMYKKGLELFKAIGSEHMIEIMRTMLTNLKMRKKQG